MRTLARRALLALALWGAAVCGAPSCRCSSQAPEGAGGDPAGGPGPRKPVRSAPPDPLVVSRLLVDDLTPAGERIVDLSASLEEMVRGAFGGMERLVLAVGRDDEGGYALGVAVAYALMVGEVPVLAVQPGTVRVFVQAELRRRGPSGLPDEYGVETWSEAAFSPDEGGALADTIRAAAAAGLRDARDRLLATIRLVGMDDRLLVDALASKDRHERLEATREAGERGLVPAAAAVARLLGDEDPAIRATALAALGRIRDESTVAAVAALTRGMNLEEARLAVYTLGDIGGPKARRYLETIAYSHPSDALRQAATQALGE